MRIAAIASRTLRWPIAGEGAARGRTERTAVIIEVCSDRGAIGLGEAAPLPGLSLDTLDEVEHAIAAFAALAPFDVAERFAAPGPSDRGDKRAAGPPMPVVLASPGAARAFAGAPPAARFAIETALLDALARERQISVAELLRAHAHVGARWSRSHPHVPVAAVVDDPASARRAFAAGIRCLKVKLAATDDLTRVLSIAAAVPQARLRIDANRSWPRAEVAARLAQLTHLPIDYVEEPCPQTHLLLSESLPCKLALDESLVTLTDDELRMALDGSQLGAIILKPTLLGGLSAALALAERARRAGVAAIVSHALEGPIGTAACAELALALGGTDPVGLAAHPALTGWRIDVPQLAPDHLRAATSPGLGLGDLDLAGLAEAWGNHP